ncbi:hypothetical protein AB0H49_33180 [Nocardia sp. NPDC050713]|uniref:hypothetical protein n=1 Tax=Nocardia sp. NPDC050713 TaxID=3154511 RepID=UPI0033E131EE
MATCIRLGVDFDTTLSIVIGAIELIIDAELATSPLATDSGQVLRTVRAATGIVTRVHGRLARPRSHECADTGRDVAAALLRGDSTKVLGHCHQIGITDAYASLAVHLLLPPRRSVPQYGPRGTAEPAARLYSELRRRFGSSALALLTDNGATILIPDAAFSDYAELAASVDALVTDDGRTPTAMTMCAPTAELPAAAEPILAGDPHLRRRRR